MLAWLIGSGSFLTNRLSSTVVWFQLVFCLAGLSATHLLRNFIRGRRYQELPFRQAWPRLLLATVTAAFIGSLLFVIAIRSWAMIAPPPRWASRQNIFACTIEYLIVLSLEGHRLELLLKEKELSATEPPVDIDFITGSLDRIRSLIDEDPGSARAGINTFSQILRKGRLKTD
jgi:hypothetical protein